MTFLFLWNHKKIATFPTFLPPNLHMFLPTLLQIHSVSFFLPCCCTHACICVCMYWNRICSVGTAFLECMFSGLFIWKCTSNCGLKQNKKCSQIWCMLSIRDILGIIFTVTKYLDVFPLSLRKFLLFISTKNRTLCAVNFNKSKKNRWYKRAKEEITIIFQWWFTSYAQNTKYTEIF